MKRRGGLGFCGEEEEEDDDIILRRESKGVSKLGEGNIFSSSKIVNATIIVFFGFGGEVLKERSNSNQTF